MDMDLIKYHLLTIFGKQCHGLALVYLQDRMHVIMNNYIKQLDSLVFLFIR